MIVKYEKTGSAAYQSHLDILRQINRILKRAGIEVKRSQGFNPHSLLFFSSPLPVGCESICEYFSLEVEKQVEDFCEKFNNAAPIGIKAVKCSEKSVDIANIVKASIFSVGLRNPKESFSKIVNLLTEDKIVIEKTVKKEKKERDIRPLIIDLSLSENNLLFKVKQGKENLRPDDFINMLLNRNIIKADELIYPVRKVQNLTLVGDRYIDIDEHALSF